MASELLRRAIGVSLSFCLAAGPALASVPPAFASATEAPIAIDAADSVSAESSPTIVCEDVSRRTENSKHFKLSDGTYQAQISTGPIHFKDKTGKWNDIDPTLVPDLMPGTYRTKAAGERLEVRSQTTTQAPVSLEGDGWSVGIDMLGVAENSRLVLGNKARYLNVAEDTDLVYESTGDGLKETLVLSSPDAPLTFDFRVSLSNLSAAEVAPGCWAFFVSGQTEPELYLGGLEVFDSSKDENGMPAVCKDASMSVEPMGDGLYVRYTLPEAWLHDPARKFPVQVDPTITSPTATYIDQAYPTTSFGSVATMKAGLDAGGLKYAYTKWNLPDANVPSTPLSTRRKRAST